MALFSSWLYVRGCHDFNFFLVICESVMALFSSWLYMRVSWLYFLPSNKAMTVTCNQEENKDMTHSHITRKKIKP
jgi:hypothetical protein